MMKNKLTDSELTVVVNTCDSYHDVLDIFFHALGEHWPDCPYPVVINTETNQYSQYPAIVHNHQSITGTDDWGGRLLSTLDNIQTDFVFMLYDDFILEGNVDFDRIKEALQLLKKQKDADVAYLINTSLPPATKNNNSTFLPLKDKIDYKLNSSPGIWRKKSLMEYTASGDTPWAWEVFGTYRCWGNGRIFYSLNPLQPDIYPYNHSKGGAIYRGKWVKEVIKKVINKYQIDINWNKRGFSSDHLFEKRSILWKIRFMKKGFDMVGIRAFYFIFSYFKEKLHAH